MASNTEASLTAAVEALNEAMEMCEEVLESSSAPPAAAAADDDEVEQGNDQDGGLGASRRRRPAALPAGLAEDCLTFVGSVLSVAADAQQLSVLDLGSGGGKQVRAGRMDRKASCSILSS